MGASQSEFIHRMNRNGTIDSICPRCYETLTTSTWEAELEAVEAEHQCEHARLLLFETTHRPPFRTTWVPAKKQDRIA
jgi:hypothetical protein